MSSQRYPPEFKDEAVRKVLERGYDRSAFGHGWDDADGDCRIAAPKPSLPLQQHKFDLPMIGAAG